MNRFHKGFILLLAALALTFILCACSPNAEPSVAPVEKVTLNKKTLQLTSGETYQLVATATPDNSPQDFNWSSSSKDYATVSNDGLVKVKNTGNSSATVKVTATSKSDSSKKATCTITVLVAPPSEYTVSSIGMVTCGPGEDAASTMIISWHSPTKGSVLEYTDADGSEFIHSVPCDGNLSTAAWADTATHYRCRVVLEGLSANKTYKYRIKDAQNNYTSVSEFKTAGIDTSFNFMWLSDLHTPKGSSSYINRVKELIGMASSKVSLDFCLFSGDMVNKGQIYKQWQNWSDSGLWKDMAFAYVAGNHDYYPYGSKDRTTNAYFKDVCAYPYNNVENSKMVLDSNYWFIWNKVLFVCVDNFTDEGTLLTGSGRSLSEQKQWFEEVVKANDGQYDYLVFVQHLPFFINDAPCDYGNYNAWRSLFDEYHVDFALSSDEHAYTRTKPLFNDAEAAGGTVYITSYQTEGGSISTPVNSASASSKYAAFYGGGGVGGVYFTVTPEKMTMHLIGAGGIEYDSVEVLKKTR